MSEQHPWHYRGPEDLPDNEDELTAEDLRIATFVRMIVKETLRDRVLLPEEREWVRLAIKADARRAKFQEAVIEKTLLAFIWFCVAGMGYLFWEGVKKKVGLE